MSTQGKTCTFARYGGYACNLSWPSAKAVPGSDQWERVIKRDLCQPCGDEVRRRHSKITEGPDTGKESST